jgi:hypothetical protein
VYFFHSFSLSNVISRAAQCSKVHSLSPCNSLATVTQYGVVLTRNSHATVRQHRDIVTQQLRYCQTTWRCCGTRDTCLLFLLLDTLFSPSSLCVTLKYFLIVITAHAKLNSAVINVDKYDSILYIFFYRTKLATFFTHAMNLKNYFSFHN